MNDWLWHHLGRAPDQRFYEWNLLMNCPDFEELRAQGLLIRDLEAEKSDFLYTKYGQSLDLIRIDGAIFGVDNDRDDDEHYIEVDPRELIQYYFNWEPWLQKVRELNGLDGESSWLHQRLVFLGNEIDAGRRLGFVLGFIVDGDTAMDLLLGLPARMSTVYDTLVVTTLMSPELPPQDIATLERLGLYVVPPIDRETLKIDVSYIRMEQPETEGIVLTPDQKADYDRYEYKCRLPIRITGKITKAGNNEVLVGDTSVEMGDVPFLLFLRLVVELRRNKSGMMSKADLRSERYFGEGTDDQSINRLRNCFVRALGGLDTKDLIERQRPKTLRLSVHPDLITWETDKLSDHDHIKVRDLAQQLVQAADSSLS